MKTVNSILAGVCALLLAACGGGGGGVTGLTGNTGLGSTTTTGVSITAVNALKVAAAVLYGVEAVTGSSDGAASAPPLITGVAVNTAPGNFSLSGVALDQLARVTSLQNGTGSGIIGVAVSLNVACSVSGSATVAANIADPNFMVLSVGDTMSVDFQLCNELGIVLDGIFDMAVSAITSPTGTFDGTPPFNVTLDGTFTALRAQDGTQYYYANGDLQQVLGDDGIGNIVSLMSGTMLDTSYNTHDQKLTGYLFDISGNTGSGDYAIDLDGTLESRDIDGTVTFSTTDAARGAATFTGVEPGDPTAGVLIIISDLDGSVLKLTAEANGVDVRLEVDPEDDGTFLPPIFTTWAALAQL